MNEPVGIFYGTIRPITEHRSIPDSTRVSALTAAVLLAFELTRVINAPSLFSMLTPVWNRLKLTLSFNPNTVIGLLAAGVSAIGCFGARSHRSPFLKSYSSHGMLGLKAR